MQNMIDNYNALSGEAQKKQGKKIIQYTRKHPFSIICLTQDAYLTLERIFWDNGLAVKF